ncbi:MAG: autorepressor SdpR family transcription factor [bacterium]
MGMNDVFKALSDPTRRDILHLLRRRDRTAGEISDAFPLAKSTLSGHFNVLKSAGLIVAERQGTRIVYSLNVSVFEEAMATVMDLLRLGREESSPQEGGESK